MPEESQPAEKRQLSFLNRIGLWSANRLISHGPSSEASPLIRVGHTGCLFSSPGSSLASISQSHISSVSGFCWPTSLVASSVIFCATRSQGQMPLDNKKSFEGFIRSDRLNRGGVDYLRKDS